jgi:threonine synthase
MDIQISSNFERYLFEASGRDAALIRAKMGALRQEGRFDLGPLKAMMEGDFAAVAASEKDVGRAIGRLRDESGYLVDPHTACAKVAAERALGSEPRTLQVVLSTAHPAKFPDAIAAVTGKRPALPERLAGLLTAHERFTVIDNDLAVAERLVEEVSRATSEGAA